MKLLVEHQSLPPVMVLSMPIILFWRDKTIDCCGAGELKAPMVYVRKGRTLTIKNIADGVFKFTVTGNLTAHGNIRIAKKPQEMKPEDWKIHHPTVNDSN